MQPVWALDTPIITVKATAPRTSRRAAVRLLLSTVHCSLPTKQGCSAQAIEVESPQPGESDDETGQNGLYGGNVYEGRGGGGGGFKGGGTISEADRDVLYKGSDFSGSYLVSSGAGGTNHVKPARVGAPLIDVAAQWGSGAATIRWVE
jgi:hypothetical protein